MSVCAMITLFNPDYSKLEKNINEISLYCERIYLLCNSLIESERFLNSKIRIIQNDRNIGLSRAINIGLLEAKKENIQFALLFDQDSFLSKESFQIMINSYEKNNTKTKIMCIGPSLNVRGNILPTPKWTLNKKVKTDNHNDSVKNIITSGMLLNIDYALEINGFDIQFPVDFCDFFFCYKALYEGYSILKSKEAFINHEIGNSCIKIFGITIHFHQPYRNYFLVRDTLNICFRKKETPFLIRIRYFIFLLPRMILFLFVLDKRKERLRMYYLGFKDFLLKKKDFGSITNILQCNKDGM